MRLREQKNKNKTLDDKDREEIIVAAQKFLVLKILSVSLLKRLPTLCSGGAN